MKQKPNRLSRPQWSDLRRDLILDCPILFDGDYNDYSRFGNMSPSHSIPSMAFKNGIYGPAFDFVSSGAELNSTAIVTFPCTVELVVTPTDLSGNQILLAFPNLGTADTHPRTLIYYHATDKELQFNHINNANRRAGSTFSWVVGETHHIIIVWYYNSATDANNSKIWVDGIDITEGAEDYWNAGNQTGGIDFGHRNSDPSDDYTGMIDSIKVWDREVMEHEIVRLANDPWLDYREDSFLPYHGAIHSSSPAFSPFWAVGSNQVL